MSLSCARLQGHKESPHSTAPASGGAPAHVRTALLSHGTGKGNKHIRKGHTQLLGTALATFFVHLSISVNKDLLNSFISFCV